MPAATAPEAVLTAIDLAQAGRFTELRELFVPALRPMVVPEALQTAWLAALSQHGPITSIGAPITEPGGPGGLVVKIPVICEHGAFGVVASATEQGQLAGIQLTASSATEPTAWGLASRGIAVLRFDKVTYAHAAEVKQAHEFTLSDEYVPHARAAVELLRADPAVNGERVFLLGHSLGGTVAPRIAAAEPSVAGLILMAGGAEPLHWAIVRQVRYLASLDPATEPASRSAIQDLTAKATLVDAPDQSPSTPGSELPLGTPASYWLDIRGYDPAATAATLGKPILILQGGRDYQVTVENDLARWKEALGERPEVSIRVYPAHNHLLAPGSGPCTPAEYEPAQHVDAAVIADMAEWLKA